MEIIRKEPADNATQQPFAPWILYSGPEWPQDVYPFDESSPVPPEDITAAAGTANVPGYDTGKKRWPYFFALIFSLALNSQV